MATSAKTATGLSYESIVRDISAGVLRSVYCLMGDEPYFIDRIADYVVEKALAPDERDFNLITLFGFDCDVATVINSAKGYPMGAKRLVVLVKEAQQIKNLDQLVYYLQRPQPSTVLVICYKNGVIDRRKKLAGMIEKNGVLFESKKIRDYQLPSFIHDYLKRRHLSIDVKGAAMLADSVGPDLFRMSGELDKLTLAMPAGQTVITPELIEKNIGVSKDFNYFELQDALVKKDVFKANQIAKYFDNNPKDNPIQVTLTMLFRFYSKLMLAYYSPQKNEKGIADWLGMNEWQVRENILPAMRNYTGVKVMRIIGQIRRTDARSKGINNPSTTNGELLKELIFFILH